MAVSLLVPLLGALLLVLLLLGRAQIAKGANPALANGAVALVIATIVGVLFVGMIVS